MFETFETYITARTSFTPEQLKLVRSLSTTRKLRKREFVLHEGEVCRHKIFVTQGLLRSYQVKDDGAEHIMKFAPENTWCIDPESYNNEIPTKYNIDALEDTEVILWSKPNMEQLFAAIPSFKYYSEKLISRSMDENQNRILMNISYTAEEKYQAFITSYPDVFRRIPLHMVASYLGVSRETLSRVRHAQVKR